MNIALTKDSFTIGWVVLLFNLDKPNLILDFPN